MSLSTSTFSGGPWKLPLERPDGLRPMLLAQQYSSFAKKINQEMSWPEWSWEIVTFYMMVFLLPPFSAYFMVSCLSVAYYFAYYYLYQLLFHFTKIALAAHEKGRKLGSNYCGL